MKLTDGQLLAVGLILASIYFIFQIISVISSFTKIIGFIGLSITIIVETLFIIERVRK